MCRTLRSRLSTSSLSGAPYFHFFVAMYSSMLPAFRISLTSLFFIMDSGTHWTGMAKSGISSLTRFSPVSSEIPSPVTGSYSARNRFHRFSFSAMNSL